MRPSPKPQIFETHYQAKICRKMWSALRSWQCRISSLDTSLGRHKKLGQTKILGDQKFVLYWRNESNWKGGWNYLLFHIIRNKFISKELFAITTFYIPHYFHLQGEDWSSILHVSPLQLFTDHLVTWASIFKTREKHYRQKPHEGVV